MAEQQHSRRQAGGPNGAARNAYLLSGASPFMWRPASPANDNPAPIAKRLARAAKLGLLLLIVGLLGYSAFYYR